MKDNWETPQWLFEELNAEFNFDFDLCATKENSKCERFFSDYLNGEFYKHEWTGMLHTVFVGPYATREYSNELWQRYPNLTCFMNPPYSDPKPFLEKAWEDSKYCKIVVLAPNTIKTCRYMDILDENEGKSTFRKWKLGLEIRDLSRRTGFVHPSKKSSSPSFGCMLLIMDRRKL